MKNTRRAYVQILPTEARHGLSENRRRYVGAWINRDDTPHTVLGTGKSLP